MKYQITLLEEHEQLLQPVYTDFASNQIKYYDVSKDRMGAIQHKNIFHILQFAIKWLLP